MTPTELRALAADHGAIRADVWRVSAALDEAADEIERLRAPQPAEQKTCQHCYDEGVRHANEAINEQRGEPVAWRDTVDDMLTVCHEVASDDPRESINRLINWHVSVALDPAVSSDAAALVQSGREQRGEPVAWMYTSRLGNSYVTNRQADPDADWRETPLYASPQPVEQQTNPAWLCACGANLYIDADGAPRSKAPQPVEQRKPLTDEQIDAAISADRDALLDLIYELGTTAEGIQRRFRKIARAIEAAHGIGGKT